MSLCKSCENSLHCPTWGETKCKAFNMRIYETMYNCVSYKKRSKDFKEPKCQCDQCLENPNLNEEE